MESAGHSCSGYDIGDHSDDISSGDSGSYSGWISSDDTGSYYGWISSDDTGWNSRQESTLYGG